MNRHSRTRRLAGALALLLVLAATLPAAASPTRVDPPFWWAGMASPRLQLMVHGEHVGLREPALSYPGVRIASVTRTPNRNYLFIDLVVDADAKPGSFDLRLRGGSQDLTYRYQLRAREPGSARRKGFGPEDAIYQLMPDRFANGDASNDTLASLTDKADRRLGHGRHGGDIRGIADRLDYIAGLGFTQIWPTPLVENAMPVASYHGYAATDHYRVDPRYGSNEDYRRLSLEARKRGIGLIQDVVLSHVGSGHWWMKDLPSPDWINHQGQFVPTHHHRVAVQDKYASREDAENFTTGWFGPGMPDMNQSSPLVANYLVQNTIWWIEYAGLSGLRIDTFGYSDGAFLADYTRRILAEYPHLNMVGEEWSKLPPVVARWQRGKANFDGYSSHMPSMMDFPLAEAMRTALSGKGPANTFYDVYETLSLDYLYPDPGQLMLFEGNHDLSRIYSVVGEDLGRYKMNLVFLMTMPRIPHFYAGDEILMTSTTGERDDSSYRQDFPGGWAGDNTNAFTGAGLSARQREAQAFVRKLVNWRRGQPLAQRGKLMHYGPQDKTWVYFRYDERNRIMVAFNDNDQPATLPTARFREMLHGAATGRDILTGAAYDLHHQLALPPRSAIILELPPFP